MGRPVVHWEFWSEDPQRVSKFYQQVFDWKIQPIAELDYTLIWMTSTRTERFEDPDGRVLGMWKQLK